MRIDPTNIQQPSTQVDTQKAKGVDAKVDTVSKKKMPSKQSLGKPLKSSKFNALSPNSPITKMFEKQVFGTPSERAGAPKEKRDMKSGLYKTRGYTQGLKKTHADKKSRLVEIRKRDTKLKLSPNLSDVEKLEHDMIKTQIPKLREDLSSIEQELLVLENPEARVESNTAKLREECGGEDFSITLSSGEEVKGMRFGDNKDNDFDPSEKTVLLFTGSGDRTENYAAPMVPELQDLGLQVVIVNPPGFGDSEGRPTADSYLRTGDALYEQLKSEGAQDKNLCVMGYSLGGAMAANLASKHPLPMIGDRTYTSMENVAKAETKRATKDTVKVPGLKHLAGKATGTVAKRAAKATVSLDVEGKVPQMEKPAIFFSGDQEKRGPEAVNIKGVDGYRFEGGHFHNDEEVWFSGIGGDPSRLSEAQTALKAFLEDFKESE